MSEPTTPAPTDEQCKERVTDTTGWHRYRCSRKAVRDGYCNQHHPDTVAARRAKLSARWEQQMADVEKRREENALRLLRGKGYTVTPPDAGSPSTEDPNEKERVNEHRRS
jgi:hypothetical protein